MLVAPARRDWRSEIWALPLLLIVAAMVLSPLGALFYGAFRSDSPRAPNAVFTMANFDSVFGGLFTGGWTQQATINSITLAFTTTILSTALGVAAAWLVSRTDLWGRRTFEVLFLIPMLYSPLIGVIGWTVLADPRAGLINALASAMTGSPTTVVDIYSYTGIVWVMVFFNMPYAFVMNVNTFRNMDPALEEAAAVSGANLWGRLSSVTFPIMMASVAAAALFIFTVTFEQFSIPGYLGSHIRLDTLAYAIYRRTNAYPSDLGGAAAAGSLLLILTSAGLYFYRRLIRRSEKFVTITARGFKPSSIQLGRWNWVMTALCVLIFVVGSGLPLLAVVLRALMPVRSMGLDLGSLDFRNFIALGDAVDFRVGLWNSVALSVGSACVIAALGFLLAHRMVRRKSGAIALADYLIAMPIGIPGTVFGVGMLWAYVGTPIYLTFWIMLLAFVTRYTVYGVRNLSSGIMQVDKSLEEAALVSGASQRGTFLFVNLPLLRPVLASLWLLVFMVVMRELPTSIILYGVKSVTLPILTWSYLNDGYYGNASALAVVQIIIVAVIVLIFKALFGVDVRMRSKD